MLMKSQKTAHMNITAAMANNPYAILPIFLPINSNDPLIELPRFDDPVSSDVPSPTAACFISEPYILAASSIDSPSVVSAVWLLLRPMSQGLATYLLMSG